MRIVVNTLWSKLETDNPELLKTLDELYTFQVEGAAYSPAFKRGQWDGKKHFITKAGKFRTGLLDRICKDLARIGCEPKIEWHTPKINLMEQCSLEVGEYVLRDYQRDLVNSSLINQRGIVDAPTGAGKTLIMASILQELAGKKTLILFHQKQILKQTYDFLNKCGIPDVGLCFGEGYIEGNIMLCTYQSIEKVLDTHDDCEVLMVDEVHEFASGKITVAAINAFENAELRFGFTGTVPRDKVKLFTLEGAFGPTIKEVSTSDLVEQGSLSKPIIQMIEQKFPEYLDDPDEPDELKTYMSYDEVYDACIVTHKERNGKIVRVVESIMENNPEAKVMLLVRSLEHGKVLQDLIPDALYLQGKDDISIRYDTINEFLSQDQSVLIGTKILQTGINIEEISHFIMARGMKSEEATLQAIGRALRKHKDKVYIYDFYDSIKYLEGHSKARRKVYKREGHEVHELWKAQKNNKK